MEQSDEDEFNTKKRMKPNTRPLTVALMFERALSMGMTYTEAFNEDVGFINDLMIEKSNDSAEYPTLGTDDEFKRL